MKAICASLILALLVTSTMSLGTCNDTAAPFLVAVKAAGLALATPLNITNDTTAFAYNASAAFAICNQTWSPEGSCCTVDGLNSVFAAKMGAIKTSWDAFVGGAVVVNTTLAKLKAMVANSTNVTADLTAALNSSATPFNALNVTQAATLAMTISMFDTAVADFKNTSAACFDALVNYRGAAMCYGCSANSTHQAFFNDTTGRLLISQATRDTIAMKCVKPWGFIYNLGGAMQVLAILNKQRAPNATSPVTPAPAAFSAVTYVQLYEAFMACPNSTVVVNGTCTQALIDRIVVAHVNLFSAEPYTNGNNLANTTSSSQARRMLAAGTNTGEIDIASTNTTGADLMMTITRPVYTASVNVTTLPDAPAGSGAGAGAGSGSGSGSGAAASAGNIFAMTAIATLAAFVLTLN